MIESEALFHLEADRFVAYNRTSTSPKFQVPSVEEWIGVPGRQRDSCECVDVALVLE